jgi:hypothetical protein
MGGPIGGSIGEGADSGDPHPMAGPFSALDPDALAQARALLATPKRPARMWPVLAAATVLALSALAFATAMIMVPPLVTEHVAGARDAS